jgi:hypothetical protein
MKFGVENLELVILFAIGFGTDVYNSAKDGKFSFWEVIGLSSRLKDIPALLASAPLIGQELNDLDDEERERIKVTVRTKLKIDDARAEQVIESAINWLIGTYQFGHNLFGK